MWKERTTSTKLSSDCHTGTVARTWDHTHTFIHMIISILKKHNANISAGPFCLMQWKSREYFVFGFLIHIVYSNEFAIIVVLVAAVAPKFVKIFIFTLSDDKNTHRRLGNAASNV